NYTVNYYISKGAVKSKLLISIGFFGIIFRMTYIGNVYPDRYTRIKSEDYNQ
ncbi:chitotriosidase-1-like isoform X3, partial [Biomphalaria glabrata]